MDSFEGECRGGPYDGQRHSYFKKRMPILTFNAGFVRESFYEFSDGFWYWAG